MRSLRSRLLALWIMLVISGVATAYLLVESFKQTANARVARSEELVARACRDIADGIVGAIFPVIVADLMRDTGRFNVAQGAVITAQSIGAALSTTLAGVVVVKAGYTAAFLTLGAIAAVGLVVCWLLLPESHVACDVGARRLRRTAPLGSAIAAE
jgi:MFS family permease